MTEQKVEKDSQGRDYIPGLDELALRLQVEPIEEPYVGIVLLGKSGRAYPAVQLLAHHVQFTAEALTFAINILTEIKEEGESSVNNQRAGQPEKTHDTSRDAEGD